MKKKAREISTDNADVTAMDKLIAANPPRIGWTRNSRGVWVSTFVDDPHPDGGHNGAKAFCKRGHPFNTTNTLITTEGHRQCRICKNLNRRAA